MEIFKIINNNKVSPTGESLDNSCFYGAYCQLLLEAILEENQSKPSGQMDFHIEVKFDGTFLQFTLIYGDGERPAAIMGHGCLSPNGQAAISIKMGCENFAKQFLKMIFSSGLKNNMGEQSKAANQ